MAKPFLCAMSGAKLWDWYFIQAAIPVHYTNEFQEPFEVITYNGKIMVLKNELWEIYTFGVSWGYVCCLLL